MSAILWVVSWQSSTPGGRVDPIYQAVLEGPGNGPRIGSPEGGFCGSRKSAKELASVPKVGLEPTRPKATEFERPRAIPMVSNRRLRRFWPTGRARWGVQIL